MISATSRRRSVAAENARILDLFMILHSLIIAFMIGLRDTTVGTDTTNYIRYFYAVGTGQDTRISDPLFKLIAKSTYHLSENPAFFFFTVAFISIYFSLYVTRLICFSHFTDPNKAVIATMLSWVGICISPFFIEMQVNIIRSAVATPLVLLAFYFCSKSRFIWTALFVVFAVSLHSSSLVFAIMLPLIFLKRWILIFIITVLSITYASGLSEIIVRNIIPSGFLSSIAGDNVRYLDATETNYRSGIRFDFLAFSIFFFGVAYLSELRLKKHLISKVYAILLIPFLTVGFIPYSDRLLSAAWTLIPILISFFFVRFFQFHKISEILFLAVCFLPVWFYFGMKFWVG